MAVRMSAAEFQEYARKQAEGEAPRGKHVEPHGTEVEWSVEVKKKVWWRYLLAVFIGFAMAGSDSPPEYVTNGCFEDQAIVQVVAEWQDEGFEPVEQGATHCISIDNLE